MAVECFDHFNIRCADIERTRSFYCDVLGLKVGERPAVTDPGYWLYCGNQPQVHLVPCDPKSSVSAANGAFDHVAFRLSDPEGMIETLRAKQIPYIERSFPAVGVRQIVVHDPDGILIELTCGLP